MKLIIGAVLLAATASVQAVNLGNTVGALIGLSGTRGNEGNIDETLARVTAEMNLKAPHAVDKETRLDRITADPGAHLNYHYTLVNARSADVNPGKFQNVIRPVLNSRLCADSEMQNFLRSGVTVSYLYRGSDGRPIGTIAFKPSDCGYKA